MTRVVTCADVRHKEEHEWHHLESAPDYRTCPDLSTVEEEDGWCCEMAPGGGCLYSGGGMGNGIRYTVRRKGDGLGAWDGDDFEGARRGEE